MTPNFTTATHVLIGLGLFWLGAVVGSFANVCVYRLPWGKSVIWPASHCPKCLTALKGRDNLPIFGWLLLRAECRNCGLHIAARYVLMEVVMGLLFVGVHLAISADLCWYFPLDRIYGGRLLMGTMLVSFLVVATMMDYDWMIITDSVTVPGMLMGLSLGTIMPYARSVPMRSTSHMTGLWVGLAGILAGFGLILFFRVIGRILFRREAMGLGDATLMGVIGAFLGWKAAILTFFIAPFFGLAHALWKLGQMIVRRLTGGRNRQADHEMPFGPYLSMAAIFCLLGWPWIWKNWAIDLFDSISMIFKEMT